jgi:NAD(P)-dependent dehydrogenase (short-subunit alcohol dehydrogenase family)
MAQSQGELKDKIVVVTGAARGMGRAYVEGFMAKGAKVVATDVSWSKAEDLKGQVESSGGVATEMDVSQETAIDKVYEDTIAKYGTVDVVINNAALVTAFLTPIGKRTLLETTNKDWETMMGVNFYGTLNVIRRFIQPMIANERGSIINVVSSGILHYSHGAGFTALRPWSQEMPYQATKAAIATMSFYLAEEVRENNVAVNILIPGHSRGAWFDDTMRARVSKGIHPGNPPVVPEHIVPIALYLATQSGKGVTGKMIPVMDWNQEHGFGGYEAWADNSMPGDLVEAYAQPR